MKWLETISGYIAVDNARMFDIAVFDNTVDIRMWLEDDIETGIIVNIYHYGGEQDFYKTCDDAIAGAERELEFIINYISDGDVCTREQYTQSTQTNIRYLEDVND